MKKKLVTLCAALALCATAIVGGTLAYFTDTDAKDNTFTVGNVDIELTEPNWKEENAKLIPGREIPKDPTITIANGSERAYTFMKVQLSEDFMTLLQKYYGADYNFVTNFNKVVEDWFILPDGYAPKVMNFNVTDGSVILGVLSPKDPGESVVYFKGIKIPAGVDGTMINENGTYKIDIIAYGIQAEGFEGVNANAQADRQAAYDALFK